jgi:aryl-alcohol dehydrogenase
MNTEAAILRGVDQPFTVESIELDEPRDDEVLVRLAAVGICHTDVAVTTGAMPSQLPVILGHEGSGIVEQVGSRVTRVQPGDHVVLTFASCGSCLSCSTGHPIYCQDSDAMNLSGSRVDGSTAYRIGDEQIFGHFVGQSSFARHAIVHERTAIKVSPDVPLELLAPLGCGIQTGAGSVINVLKPPYGSSLLVTGADPVGLSAVMAAKVVGCQTIIAVDVVPSRLALATELGATFTLDSRDGDLATNLLELTGGAGVNYCLDTTGNSDVITAAFQALSLRGHLGLVGVPVPDIPLAIDPWALIMGGRKVEGNLEGDVVPDRFIPYLIDLNRQGRFPFESFVTAVGDLSMINDAVGATQTGDIVKAVLTLD